VSEVQVETLFDEFATRYLRGERPDLGEYLERAGAERESLGALLDRFLEAVPAREPSEEEIVLVQARLEQQPPVLVLRLRRRITREAVIDALVGRLGLDAAKRRKVGRYYHELETGLLDPEPVDRSVWDVLADVLEANVRALASLRQPPPELVSGMILLRAPAPRGDIFDLPTVFAEQVAVEDGPDEVDRLFTGAV
jgi:hypothetical protein